MTALARADKAEEVDRKRWHALHECIAGSSGDVVVPFAEALVEAIPPVAVRLRRDTRLLLDLIRTHALLHQFNRERDEHGRVVATLDDYTAVYALVSDLIAEGLEATVSPAVRETVENVRVIASSGGPATVLQVARALGIDKSAASRRCTVARRSGYIRNEEPSKGKPARYVIADPLPADRVILPHPELFRSSLVPAPSESGCTVAAEDWDGDAISAAGDNIGERRRIVL
jgi:hypothetical protein